MAIARFTASADNTITNAFEADLSTRGTGSNMGYADSLEVFSIYGQTSGSAAGLSQELSRMLVKFPVSDITSRRTAGKIPASGSVSFYLRMFNAEHPFTLPEDFTLVVAPVSAAWDEGTGLDMESYKDLGVSNWMMRDASTVWTTVGGDYLTSSNYKVTFPKGYEDMEVNVTPLVEEWIKGAGGGGFANNGVGIRLTASQEAYYSSSTGLNSGSLINNTVGATESYYTKKFFARSSEFFFKRPIVEARWDSRLSDDRENFFYSSSVAPALDNLNTLYYYNYIRGRLVDIPGVGTGSILVSMYSGSTAPIGSKLVLDDSNFNVTGGWVKTGIYSASVALTAAATPLLAVFDVWHSGAAEHFTGSVYPSVMPKYSSAPTFERVTSVTNLKKSYKRNDTARFRFFSRSKNWSPTIYTKATANNPTEIITSASYSIRRVTDNYAAIPYGTGSDLSTYLSYDKDGNYFDLDMSLLEPDYMYELKLVFYNDSIGSWQEQPQTFKFRVEE